MLFELKFATGLYMCYITSRKSNMPMTPKEIIKILEKNGFVFVSSNGSHHKYKNNRTGKITIVPVHSKELKKGIEQAILKQAGVK